jgi:hypothetical protein
LKYAFNLGNVALWRSYHHRKIVCNLADIADRAAYVRDKEIEDVAADPIRGNIIGTGFHT